MSAVDRAERFDPSTVAQDRPAERGLSLVELFIAMSLLGLFIVAMYQPVIIGLRTVDDAEEREDIRQQLANALERFAREASMAKVVDTAKADEFKFDADFDGDGTSSGTEADIHYRLFQGVFERKQGSNAAVPLVSDITTVTFDYRDLNDADLTPPVTGAGNKADIRLIQMALKATNHDETITLVRAAYLHNMD